jgi:hypothetical protein
MNRLDVAAFARVDVDSHLYPSAQLSEVSRRAIEKTEEQQGKTVGRAGQVSEGLEGLGRPGYRLNRRHGQGQFMQEMCYEIFRSRPTARTCRGDL